MENNNIQTVGLRFLVDMVPDLGQRYSIIIKDQSTGVSTVLVGNLQNFKARDLYFKIISNLCSTPYWRRVGMQGEYGVFRTIIEWCGDINELLKGIVK